MILRAVVVSFLVLGQSDVRFCKSVHTDDLVDQYDVDSPKSQSKTKSAVDNPDRFTDVPVPDSTDLESRIVRRAINNHHSYATTVTDQSVTLLQPANLNQNVTTSPAKNEVVLDQSTSTSAVTEQRITLPFSRTNMYPSHGITRPSRSYQTRKPPRSRTDRTRFTRLPTSVPSIFRAPKSWGHSSVPVYVLTNRERRKPTTRPTPIYNLCRSFVNSPLPVRETMSRESVKKPDYDYVNQLFPGLLKNISSMPEVPFLESSSSSKSSAGRGDNNWGLYDGDIHCPTMQRLTKANHTMKNSFGDEKDIVSFEDEGMYQFIHTGTCTTSHQRCTGSCFQQTSTVYLLAFSQDGSLSFDPFDIPAYCSCKNIGG